MIHFSLKQLSYFIATAQAGSTAGAAQLLHVSQPAISMAVKELEAVLDEQLFIRQHAQGLTLTPFGKEKLSSARQLIAQAQQFEINPWRQQKALFGHCAVGCFINFSPTCMPSVIRSFKQLYPMADITLYEGHSEQLYQQLLEGKIELAVYYDVGLNKGISSRHVASMRPYALLPENHRLANQTQLSIKELAKEPLIINNMPQSRNLLLSVFAAQGLKPDIYFESENLESVRAMVANNLGVSLLFTRPKNDIAYDGKRLKCVPFIEDLPCQNIVLANLEGVELSPIGLAFCEEIKTFYKQQEKLVHKL